MSTPICQKMEDALAIFTGDMGYLLEPRNMWENRADTMTGWWFQPLWKIWFSWDDDIPNIWKSKIHVPNHQPDMNHYY